MGAWGGYWSVGGRLAGLATLGLALAGCSEELGPEKRTTTRVGGVVRLGSEPVRGGWIEFWPTEGTVGNLRSAPIGRDGRFEAEDVAVGLNRIGLTGIPVKVRALRRSLDPLSSTATRTIPAVPTDDLTIDLYEEWTRQNAGRVR